MVAVARRRDQGDRAVTVTMSDTTVHHRSCPLCEATCGLEITMRGDAGGAHPRRPGQPVQPGLHLPQGLDPQAAARGPRPAARPADPPGRRPGHRHLGRGQLGRGLRRDRAGPDRGARRPRPRRGGPLLRQPVGPHAVGRALQPHRGQGARVSATCSRPAPSTRCPSTCRAGCCSAARCSSRCPTSTAPTTCSCWAPTRGSPTARCAPRPTSPAGSRPSRPGAARWWWSIPAAPARPRRPTSTSPSAPAPTPTCWWP